MTVTASSTDTLTVTVEADEVVDTAQLRDIQDMPYKNSGWPVYNSAGTLQVSHRSDGDFVPITTGADEPISQGHTYRFCRLTGAGGTIQFYIP